MKSKITLFALAVTTLSLSSMAANQEAISLKNEFQQLRYENRADRDRGADKIEKVFAVLAKFGAKKGKLRTKEEFSEIVAMVGAALPFDMETESAGVIVDFIHDSKPLRAAYDATVDAMTDKCRKEFLRSTVIERECRINSGKKDADPADCISEAPFLYSTCIGMKKPE